jgi:hypothetical protein
MMGCASWSSFLIQSLLHREQTQLTVRSNVFMVHVLAGLPPTSRFAIPPEPLVHNVSSHLGENTCSRVVGDRPQKMHASAIRYLQSMSRKAQPTYGDVPMQKTLKGTKIPLPKRGEIMDAFRKIAKPKLEKD